MPCSKSAHVSAQKVVITTKKEVIEGEGFESNPDFSQYLISKIHGTFNFAPLTN